MVSDDIDISDTSNSANFNCRQNISDGCSAVGCSLIAAGAIRPSRMARVFPFFDSAMVNSSLSVMFDIFPSASARASVFQNPRDLDIALPESVLQWRGALLVRDVDVGAGLDQCAHRGGVV